MFASNTSQVANDAVFIEDTFACHLYTGNGSTQTITNGIDLSTKGGLVWIKNRSDTGGHRLFDTARGVYNWLSSNSTGAQQDASPYGVTAFNSNGFAVSDSGPYAVNDSGQTYASWTFRKQPKFFDVVTYTGNSTNRTIAHNLGSVPGCIIVKDLLGGSWNVYHRSLANTEALELNSSSAVGSAPTYWNSTTPTSTVFSLGTDSQVNYTGHDYVAYLFAHNAGGFGLTGTDNVISCGSYTGNGSTTGPTVTLGYEPQLLIVKKASDTADWLIYDNMRNAGSWGTRLNPNLPNAENSNAQAQFEITSTGFYVNSLNNSSNSSTNTSGATYIYIAIRRGPMKVPTSGTSVFYPQTRTANGAITSITGIGFPPDMVWSQRRDASGNSPSSIDKLRGPKQVLLQNDTMAEATSGSTYDVSSFDQDGVTVQAQGQNSVINYLTAQDANWYFKRAPSFFDEVCYTGTGASNTQNHNLGVVPELAIVKRRNSTSGWEAAVPSTTAGYFQVGQSSAPISLNTTNGNGTEPAYAWSSYATSTTFSASGLWWNGNVSGGTYVAYLFATCAGVSKVGLYTGTGTTLQVNCGFAAGARFVLIKRTDSTGDWYVWDSARGIVSGNDPYLLLNSTAAETTGTDYIDTYSAGFEISSTAPAAINASGGTFIFLAIA